MMHLGSLGLLALGAATVSAFRDTSPFFMASTSEVLLPSSNLALAISLVDDVSSHLKTCPSDYYVVAFQPGVHSTDFVSRSTAPSLGDKVTGKDKEIRSTASVHEVSGPLDATQIQSMIEKTCGTKSTLIDATQEYTPSDVGDGPRVVAVNFPMATLGSSRSQQLLDHDKILSDVIKNLPSKKYTLLYVTSPREFENSGSVVYQPDENSQDQPLRSELKRDQSAHVGRADSSNKSLFQEYQYLTPGLFMCLMAFFLCFIILFVGVKALMSLEVPYAAFEKDTFSSVQKKQQ